MRRLSLDLTACDASGYHGAPLGLNLPAALAGAGGLEGLRLSVDWPLVDVWWALSALPRLGQLWMHQRAPVVRGCGWMPRAAGQAPWPALWALTVTAGSDVDLVVMDGPGSPHGVRDLLVSDVPRRQNRLRGQPSPLYLKGLVDVLQRSAAALRSVQICSTNPVGPTRRLCHALERLAAVEVLRVDLHGVRPPCRWSGLCRALGRGPCRPPLRVLELGTLGERPSALWRLRPPGGGSGGPWRLPVLRITLGVPSAQPPMLEGVAHFAAAASRAWVDRIEFLIHAQHGWTPERMEALEEALSSRDARECAVFVM